MIVIVDGNWTYNRRSFKRPLESPTLHVQLTCGTPRKYLLLAFASPESTLFHVSLSS
jgi:hypothetical protein